MISNPYLGQRNPKIKKMAVTASGAPITDGGKEVPRAVGYTRDGRLVESDSPIVDSKGRFNVAAGLNNSQTMVDFMANVTRLMQMAQTKEIEVRASIGDSSYGEALEYLSKVFQTENPGALQQTASEFTGVIQETVARDGLVRKFLVVRNIPDGVPSQIRLRKFDDAYAIVSIVDDAPAPIQRTKEPYIPLKFFELKAGALVSERELSEAGSTLLEEKYEELMQGILVAEDRYFLKLLDYVMSPGMPQVPVGFTTLTPQVFSSLMTSIHQNGPSPSSAILSVDLWDDIRTSTEFANWYSPIEKHELALNGYLGSLMGVNLVTDGFRYPTFRVLDPGTIYMLAAPTFLGELHVRRAVEVTPVDRTPHFEAARGWMAHGIEAMAVVNRYAVAKGARL